jgi:hypothetical protein
MPKQFFTERDIEDMVKQGVMTLEVTDSVVLTDLAYERANRLGMRLVQGHENPPAAPVRPYVAKETKGGAVPVVLAPMPAAPLTRDAGLKQRVRDAVIARLGTQVDPALLDTIIDRVLGHISAK